MGFINFIKNILKKSPQSMEDYYNNKYPKVNLTYLRHETDGAYQIDLRDFIFPNDFTIPIVTGKDDDEKALNGLLFVIKNIKYIDDKTEYDYPEYWAFHYQTLKRKKGDCEDGAILLYNILLRSGIPYWKLRLTAGNTPDGGHCYLVYYVESQDRWVTLDWCYYLEIKLVNQREDYKLNKIYKDVWFSWNEKYCFSQGLNTTAKKMLGSAK